MLNLNSKTISSPQVWKVLIFDKLGYTMLSTSKLTYLIGQDIISPLLKVNELRDNGITVHMSINSDRQPIPDAPAIYFIDPTIENIERMKSDFSKNLYDSYCINFCKTISRNLLEELATHVVQFNASAKIAQVFDQSLNFVCLENNVFTLQETNSYLKLNNPQSKDYEIEAIVEEIVVALLSVITTLNCIPTIKCMKGNAAEMVAKKLDSKLKDHISNTKTLDQPKERPCLLITDRSIDLQTMICHTWTYASMLQDLLGMQKNRIVIKTDKGQQQKFDIDVNDFFWLANASLPFPVVADNVNLEIIKYKEDVEKVTKSQGINSFEEIDSNNTEHLKLAITAMPMLQERKRIIDMHMTIALSLMDTVKKRNIDQFFSLEESISKQSTPMILEMIKDQDKLNEDKLRLAIVYMMGKEVLKKESDEIENALKEIGCDSKAIHYIQQLSQMSKLAVTQVTAPINVSNDLLGKLTSYSTKDHIQQATVSTGFDAFLSSVKNLLPIRHALPLTKLVHSLSDQNSHSQLLHFDPLNQKSKGVNHPTMGKKVICFCVGGGNLIEYQNLVENCGQEIEVVYGGTDFPSPGGFTKQLSELVQ